MSFAIILKQVKVICFIKLHECWAIVSIVNDIVIVNNYCYLNSSNITITKIQNSLANGGTGSGKIYTALVSLKY